jgi:hypothetical protein
MAILRLGRLALSNLSRSRPEGFDLKFIGSIPCMSWAGLEGQSDVWTQKEGVTLKVEEREEETKSCYDFSDRKTFS